MAASYQRLRRHLEALKENEWCATFDQIEQVIGADLPPSAQKYAAWWSNTTSHSHALAWMKAGWVTRNVMLTKRSVVFERKSRDSLPDVEGKRRVRQKRDLRDRSSNSNSTGHPPQPTPAGGRTIILLGQPFVWVARIQPETGEDGTPWTDMPQKRYAKAAQKPLNRRHGAGPFCRFKVGGLPDASGIYAVTLDRRLVYVGIAGKSLKQRWGPQGYGRISPRNCYVGGQSTNCKVNHAILQGVQRKQAVDLWIHEMEEPRTLERQLIRKLDPPWNDQG